MLKYHIFNAGCPHICWVALPTLKFTILLSQPPKSWNFTCGQPCSASKNFVVVLCVCVCKQKIFLIPPADRSQILLWIPQGMLCYYVRHTWSLWSNMFIVGFPSLQSSPSLPTDSFCLHGNTKWSTVPSDVYESVFCPGAGCHGLV